MYITFVSSSYKMQKYHKQTTIHLFYQIRGGVINWEEDGMVTEAERRWKR